MKCFLPLLALVAISMASPVFDAQLDDMWTLFKTTHSKSYETESEDTRRFIWERNLAYINKHNYDADMGKHTYKLGMNEYGDLTHDEYSQLSGFRSDSARTGSSWIAPENVNEPTTVDWREKGYVTPVKNQAQCGSCWAFSSTGSLEGQYFRKTGKLASISEQNLVDCSRKEGNMGCEGGLMDNAFRYVKINDGIDSEESYPYEAKDGECRYKKSDSVTTDTGFVDIPHGDEAALKKAVASIGPISVAIDASHMSFQFYKHGVYVEPECSSTQLDHGVLVVGYGTEDGQDYWLVKNSWGTSWGLQGYIKMARNHDNMCGIASQASYPLL